MTSAAWPVWPWWTQFISEAPGKTSSGRRTPGPFPSAEMTALKSRHSWCTSRETSTMVGKNSVCVCVCSFRFVLVAFSLQALIFSSYFLRLCKMLIFVVKYSYVMSSVIPWNRLLFSARLKFCSLAQTPLVRLFNLVEVLKAFRVRNIST